MPARRHSGVHWRLLRLNMYMSFVMSAQSVCQRCDELPVAIAAQSAARHRQKMWAWSGHRTDSAAPAINKDTPLYHRHAKVVCGCRREVDARTLV